MVTHHITAAHNGLRWTIAMNRDGDPIERNIKHANGLDHHIECTCSATFGVKNEAVAHLKEVANSDNGEEVTRYSNGIAVNTTTEGLHG